MVANSGTFGILPSSPGDKSELSMMKEVNQRQSSIGI